MSKKSTKRHGNSTKDENDTSDPGNDDPKHTSKTDKEDRMENDKSNESQHHSTMEPMEKTRKRNKESRVMIENNPDRESIPEEKKKKKKKKKDTTITQEDPMHIEIKEKEPSSSIEYEVYIEGIPFDSNEDEVKEFFLSHDCTDIAQIRLPKWQDTGRLRGFGHVMFHSMETRHKALQEVNGQTLKTRYITVQLPKPPKVTTDPNTNSMMARSQPKDCKVIFVKNLPYENCNEQDIENTFRTYGKIIQGGIRLVRHPKTRQSKGFAFIEYKNPEGALAAVTSSCKENGIRIQGRRCMVDYDEGKVKESFRTADGRLWKKEFGTSNSVSSKKRKIV